jgi:hypothetical protein
MPNDESMSEVSRAVFAALSSVTSLAKPILNAQCKLLGYDPNALSVEHLEKLVPRLSEAVERFGSVEKVRALRAALLSSSSLDLTAVMDAARDSRPSGCRRVSLTFSVDLGPFAKEVRAALSNHSPLSWSLLEAQCERRGRTVQSLEPDSLRALLPELERSLKRFGSAEEAEATCVMLERLSRRAG